MAEWPERGQKAPNYWDETLRGYIDAGDHITVPEGVTPLPLVLSDEGLGVEATTNGIGQILSLFTSSTGVDANIVVASSNDETMENANVSVTASGEIILMRTHLEEGVPFLKGLYIAPDQGVALYTGYNEEEAPDDVKSFAWPAKSGTLAIKEDSPPGFLVLDPEEPVPLETEPGTWIARKSTLSLSDPISLEIFGGWPT